jgi:hypothetical protein
LARSGPMASSVFSCLGLTSILSCACTHSSACYPSPCSTAW